MIVGEIVLPFICFVRLAIVTGAPLLALVSETHWTFAESIIFRFSMI